MITFHILRRTMAVALVLFAAGAGAQTLISIGGTGSSGPLMQKLFEDFRKRAPDVMLKIVTPPLGSGGGMKAVQAGKIDIAVVARDLTDEEQKRAAETFPLAETPMVMVGGDPTAGKGLSFNELAAIYAGKTVKWKSGAPIRLVLRAKFDGDTVVMRSGSPALSAAIDQALERPGMVIANDDIDAVEMLTRTPGALGPTNLALLRALGSSLTPIPLNGVTPSVATLRNGTYPWRKAYRVVVSNTANPAAKRFVDYLKSGEADVILLRHDGVRPRP